MLKKDLILKNPLRAWEPDTGRNTATPRMGLVVARRGAGKTALLVQFALDSLLRGNRVVHVSIGQSLEKTKAWYEDLFQELSSRYRLDHVGEVHAEIARNRMIMTFNAASFSVPRLEERLTDLIEQDIFHPDCLVIDGYDFAAASREQVGELLAYTRERRLHTWCTALGTGDAPASSPAGVPAPGDRFEDLFETVLLIDPERGGTTLRTLKSEVAGAGGDRELLLDPTTLLVRVPA
jgi:hypothetical protein